MIDLDKSSKMMILNSYCDSLNRLLKNDPSLACELIRHDFQTNEAIVNDQSFIARSQTNSYDKNVIGFMGILNGLVIDAFGDDYKIAYMIDNNTVKSFVIPSVVPELIR